MVHWEQRIVDYTVDPSVDSNVARALAATNAAMSSWSGTVGAPELQSHVAAAVAGAPTGPGYDQKNGVFYMAQGYAPAGRALAITVLTYDNKTGRILDADIIVNGSYDFAVLHDAPSVAASTSGRVAGGAAHPSNTDGISHQEETPPLDSVYDLHHVIAHELGHTLGMNDEMARKDALMYRYSSPNDATMRAPAADDIAGLAELYSTKLEGAGNGCGNATVAPKKPSLAASQLTMAGALAFLFFLVLRARTDRRARLAFVVAGVGFAYALLPDASSDRSGVARASTGVQGHARARVLGTSTSMEDGLLKTTYKLATTICRAATCPKTGTGVAWGGAAGDIRQEVGSHFAPSLGDDVDVSFAELPDALAPLTLRLGQKTSPSEAVRVVTRAD